MPDLTKAQQERARREMVRQKQQAAQEKKDIRMNEMRSENIMRRKRAAEKMGKTFSYKDITTPSVEVGPLNYGSPMKKSSCIKMYDKKGKQTGLMMEGSVAHMESMFQEKKNLMKDMPVDSKASAMEMSPYKMDHGSMANYGSPAMQTDPNKDKKDKKELTGAQKLKMAGAVLGKDVSFLVKTFDDPRSSRSIVEIKKELKNKNPEKYKEIYGG